MALRSEAWTDLRRRVISGALLALVALGSAWVGRWPFAIVWCAAGIAVFVEWTRIVMPGRSARIVAPGTVALIGAALAAHAGLALAAAAVLLLGAAAVWLAGRSLAGASLAGLGVFYAGASAVPAILLRGHNASGLVAVLFLFAIVWGSDVMAYFSGRLFGGPKLWPSVSPNKTWSGFAGGTLCAALAGAAVAALGGVGNLAAVIILGLVLAVVSQGGDLFESAIKRRFGAKDAGTLIPGHGGAMDRLDGFAAAGIAALVIALLRMPGDLGWGLMRW